MIFSSYFKVEKENEEISILEIGYMESQLTSAIITLECTLAHQHIQISIVHRLNYIVPEAIDSKLHRQNYLSSPLKCMCARKKTVFLLSTFSASNCSSDKNHRLGKNVPSNPIDSLIHQDAEHSGWTHLNVCSNSLMSAKLFVALSRSTQCLSQLRS